MTDQIWHVLAGMAIVSTLGAFLPWWMAVVISMTIAAAREQWQHPGRCGEGCRTDLVFWAGGSLMAVPILWMI